MKKWLIGGAIAIVCILAVCTCIVVYTLSQIPSTVPSIGVIGGADLPTAQFVLWRGLRPVLLTSGGLIVLILLLVAGVAVYKSRRKA